MVVGTVEPAESLGVGSVVSGRPVTSATLGDAALSIFLGLIGTEGLLPRLFCIVLLNVFDAAVVYSSMSSMSKESRPHIYSDLSKQACGKIALQ